MTTHHSLRAIILILLLVTTSLLPAFSIIQHANAQTTDTTTFYFKNYSFELDFLTGTQISETYPTTSNYSALPPINNKDDFISWVLLWGLIKTSENLNDSYYDDLGFLTGLFNPFKISETYTYQGEETITVEGDAYFKLFFNSFKKRILSNYQDQIEVKILHRGDPVGNKTITIEPGLLEGLVKKEYSKNIILNDLNFQLRPGERLGFSIELKLTEKPFTSLLGAIPESGPLRDIFNNVLTFVENRINGSDRFESIQQLFQIKNEALAILDEYNVTNADIAELLNDVLPIHAFFVYDSPQYPSSVTVPFTSTENTNITYYLRENNQLLTEYPSNSQTQPHKLKGTPITFESEPLSRNKILNLNNATVSLYLSRFALPIDYFTKKTVTVTLIAGNETIATSTAEIPPTELKDVGKLLLSLRDNILGPRTPTQFTFTNTTQEITHGTPIKLRISFNQGGFLTRPKLFYNRNNNPSSLQLNLQETDNIKITATPTPATEQIVPGDQITYNLSITSTYQDTITINTTKTEEIGDWTLTSTPAQLTINAGETKTATITATSTDNTKESYGDLLNFKVTATGKTGKDTYSSIAEISENAIIYNVTIDSYTETKTIKKGTNATFYFIFTNRNTGATDDTDTYSISATSKNNWNLQYIDTFRGLKRGTSTNPNAIPVIVTVPENTTLENDTITFTVTSQGSNNQISDTVTVTVNVLSPTFFESIYDFFESVAQSIGLDDALGEYAPLGLVSLILIIVLFIIIILALLLTKKTFNAIIDNPIQEIDPYSTATFNIDINNHTNKTQTFTITTPTTNPKNLWNTSIIPDTITVAPKDTETIQITVTPTNKVNPSDWIEIPLTIQLNKRKKTITLSTMISVREGKPLIQITDVFTWPKDFTKGERIITSFKVHNKGSLSAPNTTILLYLNGKQKNKVKLTLPSGSYADIKMPWTAVKGKNKILIKAVEKKH